MLRMPGVRPQDASFVTRFIYRIVRRAIGKLGVPPQLTDRVQLMAHQPRLLRAMGQMEVGQGAVSTIPQALKILVSIKASMLIGCPF